MSEEILVNVSERETRVAVVDHGVLQDIHIERAANRGIVGNIYLGKVVRVLPGMQAAFVDIGEELGGKLCHPDLGVPHSRRCIAVNATKVSLAIDQHVTH